MYKDNFDLNIDDEITSATPSSEADFDAELIALLGEDLFQELSPRKAAPAKKMPWMK